MKNAKSRLASKTNWTAVLIAMMGFVEVNAGLLQELLGKWYGMTYIAIGLAMIALREVTKGPVK